MDRSQLREDFYEWFSTKLNGTLPSGVKAVQFRIQDEQSDVLHYAVYDSTNEKLFVGSCYDNHGVESIYVASNEVVESQQIFYVFERGRIEGGIVYCCVIREGALQGYRVGGTPDNWDYYATFYSTKPGLIGGKTHKKKYRKRKSIKT
jgi:hypothetical protein